MKKAILLATAALAAALIAGCAKQDVGDAEKDPPKGSVQAPAAPAGASTAGITEAKPD